MARRLAQKHDVPVTSDFDAVRQLRLKGIDPFERANMLELVVPDSQSPATTKTDPKVQLPQTVKPTKVPSNDLRPEVKPKAPESSGQLLQIQEIQRDIARRRRRKLSLLLARLAFFVGLPTFIAGYYYFKIATPMYATQAEFVIQQAEGAGSPALGGLFSGTGFATSQDSITVQSYLTSRDAMIRLDEDAGFKTHFSQDFIDPIQRLPENASNEDAYDLYQDVVQIGYDPTEGIIKMEVIAASPEVSAEYSDLLIDYAEERVDRLTQRLREDQMAGARGSFEEAEAKMLASQQRVLELQEQLGVLDPAAESGSVMSQITAFETQLREKRLELDQLLSNRRPNAARVAGVEGDLDRLRGVIGELRSEMTDGTGDVASLARVSAELRIAETDLQTRTALMQQALQQLETARIEANRQVRYLSLGVLPIAPDEPTYPRAFENTLLAFLVFSGIYLMMSLTASILREQVSS
ncbi:capsule biosynthesis protein [Palleronia abyssalis]|nr:capsule biosynthesis protein [Palleronia abyssalis]